MALDTAADTMFFLPWQHTPADDSTIPSTSPDLIPPSKNWDRGFFSTNDLRAPYYIARAPLERAVIIGCSGLNTHTILSPADVKKLNQAGISIAWMALPKIPHGSALMETYLPLAREFFTNKNSPARILMNSDVPRYALTHSTGGQIFFHLLHEPETSRKLSHIFSGAVHVTPYFDTAHASRDHANSVVQTVFKKYMAHQSDVSPNERLIAKSYIRMNDFIESLGNAHLLEKCSTLSKAFVESPRGAMPKAMSLAKEIFGMWGSQKHNDLASTCGQILELQSWGQRLTAKDHFNPEACGKIPSIFVIGDKDNFACPKAAIDVANKIGAEVKLAEGGLHDPLRSHPHLLDEFIQRVQECAARYEQKKAQTVYVSPASQQYEPEPIPYGLIDRLRDGTRFALQRSTSSLNSFACLI